MRNNPWQNQRKSNALRDYEDRAKLLSAHACRSQCYGKRVGARATQPTEREISPSFSAASFTPTPDPFPTPVSTAPERKNLLLQHSGPLMSDQNSPIHHQAASLTERVSNLGFRHADETMNDVSVWNGTTSASGKSYPHSEHRFPAPFFRRREECCRKTSAWSKDYTKYPMKQSIYNLCLEFESDRHEHCYSF